MPRRLTSYRNLKPTRQGALRTKLIGVCTDGPDGMGTNVYVEIYFVDGGEPGDRDKMRFFFSYDPNYASDPTPIRTYGSPSATRAPTSRRPAAEWTPASSRAATSRSIRIRTRAQRDPGASRSVHRPAWGGQDLNLEPTDYESAALTD